MLFARQDAAHFFESLKSMKVAVIGLGVSHNDMITMLLGKGIGLTLLDKRKPDEIEEYTALAERGVQFVTGNCYLDGLEQFDMVIRAPGVYFLKHQLVEARRRGVIVTSEMELFFDLCPSPIYAVTGSDGKTTTTTLIGEMLKASGKRVFVGGNIGRALLPLVEQITPDDTCVVELSSFQLISMRQSPDVAVITNISPNHLDVHTDMDEYIDSKKNLLVHQNAFSRAVLNNDNESCATLRSLVRGKPLFFSRKGAVEDGAFLDGDGYLCRAESGISCRLFHMDDIKIPGLHNVENYLAAISAVGNAVSNEVVHSVAKSFCGVEHRIEFVRELDGVRYYNNSIASSPTRTIAELHAFNQKMIVICGGYDKKIPYEPLAPALIERAKLVVLLGETSPKIRAAVEALPAYESSGLRMIDTVSMEQAVAIARENATQGDVVSLSPASASFDLYKNFEERGRHFKQIVMEL